jgi:oligopeptidase A
MLNPILNQKTLPNFSKIHASHMREAIENIISENKIKIDEIIKSKIGENPYDFINQLDKIEDRLARAWAQITHLNSVVNTKEIRDAFNASNELITNYYSNLNQNPELYKKFTHLKNTNAYLKLNKVQQKVVNDEIRNFELGGVNLEASNKNDFLELQADLSKLASRFEENILDETNNFKLNITDPNLLLGIPSDVIEFASSVAKDNNQEGYTFTLHFPSYIPVLQYAENRDLRETLYKAYAKKASEFSNPSVDNSKIIEDILNKRHQLSTLLGFNNYAELSISTKMANSPEEVINFLMDLAKKAKPFAQKDFTDLINESKKYGIENIEAWDISFLSEKLKKQRFNISDQEIKKYFPQSKVLNGLFSLIEQLYGLKIIQANADVWHKDVLYFEIYKDNKLIAGFYFDLYARNGKRSGAWMDECISKSHFDNNISYPVAYLTCNFSQPNKNVEAYLTHDEVITLFHEFGHGLHHMLTEVTEYSLAGIKGVEWDAVELPSQFMENFCWDFNILQKLTLHADSSEPISQSVYEKLILSKNFQSGMQTVRQVEFALFDILIHMKNNLKIQDVLGILEKVREDVAVIKPPYWNRFPHSFSHIFAGGYAAGYYSYKWAEVLSADVFDAFLDAGLDNNIVSARFKDEILSRGGSRPIQESFFAFMNREPSIDALLKHSGLTL